MEESDYTQRRVVYMTRHTSKILKWLKLAVHKDTTRPVQQCINIGENVVATDGVRIHVVAKDGDVDLPDGTREFGYIPSNGMMIIPDDKKDLDYP